MTRPPLPAEHAVLLSCARVRIEPPDERRLLGLVEGPLDWDEVRRQGERHRMTSFLFRHLSNLPAGSVPGPVVDALRTAHAEDVARRLRLTRDLGWLVGLLAASGIGSLPFKGPVLALDVYGDLSLRTFADLDLLLRREDVTRARDLLRAHGFEPSDRLRPLQEREQLRTGADLALYSRRRQTKVELHWRFTRESFACRLDPAPLWERARPLALGEGEVHTLDPDDLLLVLAVHGGKHAWTRLDWIADVAELVRRDTVSWPVVFDRAREAGVDRMLRLALALAHDLLEASLPPDVEGRVRTSPDVAPLAALVRSRLFTSGEDAAGLRQAVETLAFHLRTKDALRDRIRFLHRTLFWPAVEDWRHAALPDRWARLYPAVRLLRLSRRVVGLERP